MSTFHFIDYFLDVTQDVESPTSFLFWSALAAIGCVLRDNIWYDFPERRSKVHGNLGILFVARSASARKSTPLKIVGSLIKNAENTKVIEGRATLEGVIKELANQYTNSKGNIIKNASGLLYAEELKSFLNRSHSGIEVLTDLLDYHDTWDHLLASQDKVTLKELCLSILAASNEIFLRDIFTEDAVKGGLAGRLLIIHEYKARKKHSGMFPSKNPDWAPLEEHLKYLTSLKYGPLKMDLDTRIFFDRWYDETDFDVINTSTGYEGRLHTHALKVALNLAACEPHFEGQVRIQHFEKAIELLCPLHRNYSSLLLTTNFSQVTVSQAAQEILTILLQSKNGDGFYESALTLKQKTFGKITDLDIFNKAIESMEQMEWIRTELVNNKPVYRLTEACLRIFVDVIQERGKAKGTVQ